MSIDRSYYLRSLGGNLKKLRKEKSLSLRQMAALCSIDHSDIGKVEKGQVNVTVLTLVELAKALEVRASLFIDFDTEPK